MRSCRRARPAVATFSTPGPDGNDSDATLYSPSRSPTPLVDRKPDLPASSSSKTVKAERSPKPKKRSKRSSPGRHGEPRREQNMVAQKKYRDKKVHAANLVSPLCLLGPGVYRADIQMSEYLVQIQVLMECKGLSAKQEVARLESIMREYRCKVMGEFRSLERTILT